MEDTIAEVFRGHRQLPYAHWIRRQSYSVRDGGRQASTSEISSEGNHIQYKLLAYIKVTNTYMLEAWNDVAKARLFGRACSTCCAGGTWSPFTSSTAAGPWSSTPPPLVFRAAVVSDVGPTGTKEPPCSIDSNRLLLFRGTSRKVSASSPSSVSSSDQAKIAYRRLLAGFSSEPPSGSLIFSAP